MKRKSYVKFVEKGRDPNGRPVFIVETLRGEKLGEIGWYAAWRQNVFLPQDFSLYSHDCLEDIAAQVTRMNAGQLPLELTAPPAGISS